MNKQIFILIAAFTTLIAGCKKVDVDFTYSPKEPKAGEIVKFNNNSSAGETWAWDFGDNVTSMLKNPSHTFKKPGTYLVTLMVDSAKYNTCTHSITVYDTIPTFVTSADTIYHYTDVTLTANIYNPFAYTLSYQWTLPEGCVLKQGELSHKSIVVYFTDYNKEKNIELTITQKDKQYHISKNLLIHETKAPAIVMALTNSDIMRQRMINDYLETPSISPLAEDASLITQSTDTAVIFNSNTYLASKMQDIFPGIDILRIQIDPIAQKWYIITNNGLQVANLGGTDIVTIDTQATGALYVDNLRNRIYWATAQGLKAMPLIKSKNNQFSIQPLLFNSISDIDRIIVNNNPR